MKKNLAWICLCLLCLQGCVVVKYNGDFWEKVILPTVVVKQTTGHGTGIIIEKNDVGKDIEEIIVLTAYHNLLEKRITTEAIPASIIEPPLPMPSTRPSTQPALNFTFKMTQKILSHLDIYITLKRSQIGNLVQQKTIGEVIAFNRDWDLALLKAYVPKGISFAAHVYNRRIFRCQLPHAS